MAKKQKENKSKRVLTNIAAALAERFVIRCPDCGATQTPAILKVGDTIKCGCGVVFDIVNYKSVVDVDELKGWLELAKKKPLCAVDIETMSPTGDSFDMYSGKIVGMSFSVEPHAAIYVPLRHAVGKNMDFEVFKEVVAPFLVEMPLAAHNASGMEWPWLYLHLGVEPNFQIDTIIVAWLDDSNRVHRFDPRSVKLKALAVELWDIRVTEFQDLVSKDQNFGYVDVKTATPYGCQDSDLTMRLHCQLTESVKKTQPFIFKLEHELIPLLGKMKLRGLKLNTKFLVEGEAEIFEVVKVLERETFELMGFSPPEEKYENWPKPFELGSPKRVSEHLFFKMNLPYDPNAIGKSGVPSSSADALADLRDDYPVVEKLLSYREAEHMANSFLRSLPEFVNPVSGYIHHGINQTGAPTGRFSHSAPNTAAVPKKRE